MLPINPTTIMPQENQGDRITQSSVPEESSRKAPIVKISATLLVLYGLVLLVLIIWYNLQVILLEQNFLFYMAHIVLSGGITTNILIPIGALFLVRAGWILLRDKYEKGVRNGRIGTILIFFYTLFAFYAETNSGYRSNPATIRGYLIFLFLNILLFFYLAIFKAIIRQQKN